MPDGKQTDGAAPHRAGAFDVRSVIAALLGIYGVIVLVTGFFTSDEDLAKAGDLNVNVWAGIGMLAAAVIFQVWAMVRPIVVPEEFDSDDE